MPAHAVSYPRSPIASTMITANFHSSDTIVSMSS
jgi:hypothetical protein